MAEKYNSKIVLSSGEVLMDLTQDTVVADKLLKGFTAHGKDGAPITGSCEFDADTGDATAGAAEILTGKTAYVTGSKVTGTMPNNGAKTLSITEKGKPVTIPQGYHDGSGKAQIDAAEEAKLIPTNIREGITVLGVLGTMSGSEGMKPQAKSDTVTPETLMAGVIAHNAAGERIVGSCVAKEFNVDGSVVRLVDVPSRTMQQEGTMLKLSPAAINEHTLTI